jgi:hypothetical protein
VDRCLPTRSKGAGDNFVALPCPAIFGLVSFCRRRCGWAVSSSWLGIRTPESSTQP